MAELDKTGLEAAARAICESTEADIYNHLPEKGIVKASYRQQARDGVCAYLSTAPVVAWRVLAEPNLPVHFALTKADAYQLAHNLLTYRKGCTKAWVEPLYAFPRPSDSPSATTSAGVTEEQTPRVTDAMVEAACAATVLGEDEFGKPVHLSPAEARCALEASRVAPVSQKESEELWALCYLHDWDPPREGQEHRWEPGKNIFPAVHAFYTSWQDAEAIRKDMTNPAKYWVVRARTEDEARMNKARASSPSPAPAVEPVGIKALREAAENVVNFAWSAVVTDCTESADYLNELITELRSALVHPTPPPVSAPVGENETIALLREVRTWIGDGENADDLGREIWTDAYADIVDRVDDVLARSPAVVEGK